MNSREQSKPLPRRARDLCKVILRLAGEKGYAPSHQEAADVMGITETQVRRLARDAAECGAIVFDRRIARSWRVVDLNAVDGSPRSKKARGK